MFNDEEFGRKPQKVKDLEPMSLDELDEYIVEMQIEIERTKVEINKKKKHMDSVSSVFK